MEYLLYAHSFIGISAVIVLALIDTKVAKILNTNKPLQKDIGLHATLAVKIVLTLIFGLLPVFIFVKNMN